MSTPDDARTGRRVGTEAFALVKIVTDQMTELPPTTRLTGARTTGRMA
jgi:hypothetical protein